MTTTVAKNNLSGAVTNTKKEKTIFDDLKECERWLKKS